MVTDLTAPEDVGVFVRALAAAYARHVDYIVAEYGKTPEEAAAAAHVDASGDLSIFVERHKGVSYHWLGSLLECDPDAAMRVWREVCDLAESERIAGHYAAEPIGVDESPWTKAQFLVLRTSFIDQWQPAGGIDLALIDMLAQSFVLWQQWLESATMWGSMTDRARRPRHPDDLDPPRLSAAEAHERAILMADRFNRLYLRTLRGLRDSRRYAVIVNGATQVNIGDRQINTTGDIQP